MLLSNLTLKELKNNPNGFFFSHTSESNIIYVNINNLGNTQWTLVDDIDSSILYDIGTCREFILNTDALEYKRVIWQNNYELLASNFPLSKRRLINAII